MIGPGGIDPHLVIVVAARRAQKDRAGLAARRAASDRLADEIDDVRIGRVDRDVAGVIAGDIAIVVRPDPRHAAVVRAIKSVDALAGDHGVEAQGPRRVARRGQADAAKRDGRPALAAKHAPARPAVGRAPDGAARARDRREIALPGILARLPGGGEDDVRVLGIGGQINGAGVVIDRQGAGPGLAAVGGAKHTAIGAGLEEITHGGDQNLVGIGRVDQNAPDVAGLLQAERLPALAAVDGLEHARAAGHVIARFRLAGADIDGVGIGRGHGDGADRRGRPLVEQGGPGPPGVVGPPHAAARRAEYEAIGPRGHTLDHFAPPAAERTDQTPVRGELDGRGRGRRRPGAPDQTRGGGAREQQPTAKHA